MAKVTWIKCDDGEWRTERMIARNEARKRYREKVEKSKLQLEFENARETVRQRT
jgi:hypothetical protein